MREKEEYWYKIVDIDRHGNAKMLFHGINRNKVIPRHRWIQAEMKTVKDGTSKTTYTSGWHVMKSIEDCIEYLKKFKHIENKIIIRCKIKGKIWPKNHSPADVWLAEWLWFEEIVE